MGTLIFGGKENKSFQSQKGRDLVMGHQRRCATAAAMDGTLESARGRERKRKKEAIAPPSPLLRPRGLPAAAQATTRVWGGGARCRGTPESPQGGATRGQGVSFPIMLAF